VSNYQRPLTPQFYPDRINWLISNGKMVMTDITISGLSIATGSNLYEMFDMKPGNLQTITASGLATTCAIKINTNVTDDTSASNTFIAILGHNFYQAGLKFKFQTDDNSDFSTATSPALTEIVNTGGDVSSGNWATPAYNGWSLFSFSQTTNNQYIRLLTTTTGATYAADIKIGCILYGKYIDMPHAPSVALTRDWEAGAGSDISESDGGMRYSNLKYINAPDWFLAPYQISANNTPEKISRLGRLKYELTFPYLTESQLIVSDLGLSPAGSANPIYNGNSIFNILQYTIGAHLPFLYQPDNTVTGNYDFFLCRVTAKEEKQIVNNVWEINMIIEEEY